MKLVHLASMVAMAVALSACAKPMAEPPMAMAKEEMAQTTQQKTVVYRCQQGKTLTVAYSFLAEKAESADVSLGKKVMAKGLKRKMDNDFTTFESSQYRWNADAGLTYATAEKTAGGNFFKLGKNADQILAKLCEVDEKATLKANSK